MFFFLQICILCLWEGGKTDQFDGSNVTRVKTANITYRSDGVSLFGKTTNLNIRQEAQKVLLQSYLLQNILKFRRAYGLELEIKAFHLEKHYRLTYRTQMLCFETL
jgi:hypothetical protein